MPLGLSSHEMMSAQAVAALPADVVIESRLAEGLGLSQFRQHEGMVRSRGPGGQAQAPAQQPNPALAGDQPEQGQQPREEKERKVKNRSQATPTTTATSTTATTKSRR